MQSIWKCLLLRGRASGRWYIYPQFQNSGEDPRPLNNNPRHHTCFICVRCSCSDPALSWGGRRPKHQQSSRGTAALQRNPTGQEVTLHRYHVEGSAAQHPRHEALLLNEGLLRLGGCIGSGCAPVGQGFGVSAPGDNYYPCLT